MKLEGRVVSLSKEIEVLRAGAEEMNKTQAALEDRCKLAEEKYLSSKAEADKTSSDLKSMLEQRNHLEKEKINLSEELEAKRLLLDRATSSIESISAEKDKLSAEIASKQETLELCFAQVKKAEAICSSVGEKSSGYETGFQAGGNEAFRVLRELVLQLVPEETLKSLPIDFGSLTYKKGLKFLTGEDPNVESGDEWLEGCSSEEESETGTGKDFTLSSSVLSSQVLGFTFFAFADAGVGDVLPSARSRDETTRSSEVAPIRETPEISGGQVPEIDEARGLSLTTSSVSTNIRDVPEA